MSKMSELYQKFHGLPGIGINGGIGQDGERGNSVYFGYVNDFFDGVMIDVDNYVYIAKRISDNYSAWKPKLDELNNSLVDKIPDLNVIHKNVIKQHLSNCQTYYTGSIYNDNDEYAEYKLDFSNDGQLMGAIISDKKNNVQIEYEQQPVESDIMGIQSVTVNDKGTLYRYYDLYNYEKVGNTYQLSPDSRLQKLVSAVPFDSNDAAYHAYQNINEHPEFNSGFLYDKANSADSLYNKVWDKLYDNVVDYAKEMMSYNNVQMITDTNIFNAVIDSSISNKLVHGEYLISQYGQRMDLDPYSMFKTAVTSEQPLYDNEVSDIFGNYYYGIEPTTLYDGNIYANGSIDKKTRKYVKNVWNGSFNIFDSVNTDFHIDYYSNINKYSDFTANDLTDDVKYVTRDKSLQYKVPTTLSEDYKPGDVLYFYTNEYINESDIEYMVVLSEDMMRCSVSQLINYAQVVNPFDIRYLSVKDKRVVIDNGVAVLKANANNDVSKFHAKSAASLMSKNDNTALVVGNNVSNGFIRNVAVANSSSYANLDIKCIDSSIVIETNATFAFSNICLNNGNDINAELAKFIYDNNIIIEDEYVHSIGKVTVCYDQNKDTFIGDYIYANDFFKDTTDMSGFLYGYEIYNEDGILVQNSQSNNEYLDMFYKINLGESSFSILLWASSYNGIKHYSKRSRVDIVYDIMTGVVTNAEVTLLGGNIVKDTTGDALNYEISSITADPNNNVSLKLNLPDNYVISKVTFDLKEASTGALVVNDWSEITKVDDYNYNISIGSNVANGLTMNDYVTTGCVTGTDGDSKLFHDIANGIQPLHNPARSVVVNVEYYDKLSDSQIVKDGNKINIYKYVSPDKNWILKCKGEVITDSSYMLFNDNTDNTRVMMKPLDDFTTSAVTFYSSSTYVIYGQKLKEVNSVVDVYFGDDTNYTDVTNSIMTNCSHNYKYQTFKVTQPAFTDTRDIPEIKLTMYNNMSAVERYNTIENGVKCNQFVTYLDVNVEDFADKWAKFIDNSTNITMDFVVQNIPSDINWQKQNIVQNSIARRTSVKLALEQSSYENDAYVQNENYVMIYPSSSNEDISCYVSSSLYLYDNATTDDYIEPTTYVVDGKEYIVIDSSLVEYCSHPEYIYAGLQDDIKLHFTNIKLNDLKDNAYRLKLLFEFGNPMIANLYFRFAVTQVEIHVDRENKTPIKFSATLDKQISYTESYNRRLLQYNSNIDYKYSFISEPLDVMINPMSYISCPVDKETHITNIQGGANKVGNREQVSTLFKFYNDTIYDNELLMDTTSEKIRASLLYNWSSLKIKGSYLQDNVRNIAISSNGNLIALTYKGSIMNPANRNGKYSFYYNQGLYDLDRYSQFSTKIPVRIKDNNSINVRTDELIDSIYVWNKEYLNTPHYEKNITFAGKISLYGNGYTQLLSSVDKGQYSECLSLADTQLMSNEYIYKYENQSFLKNEYPEANEPLENGYFRTLLYDINHEYANNEYKYLIVNDFDMLLQNTEIFGYDKLEKLNTKITEGNYNGMVSYSSLYDISPRVAYNIDKQTLNVIMLRKPSINTDTDIVGSFDKCYKLNKKYFDEI